MTTERHSVYSVAAGADPESPVALMAEMHAAAERTVSPPACGTDGKLTPYGEVAHHQLEDLIDQFAASTGSNVRDALAFSLVAGRILAAFSQSVAVGNPDWHLYIYAIDLLGRMHTCLASMVEAEPPISNASVGIQ